MVLKFHPELAPIKIAVLPLLKRTIGSLKQRRNSPLTCVSAGTVYDDTASIGRLYRRQDEVGTPFCVTVDVQTVGDERRRRMKKSRFAIAIRWNRFGFRSPRLSPSWKSSWAGKWAEVAQEHGVKERINPTFKVQCSGFNVSAGFSRTLELLTFEGLDTGFVALLASG